MDISAESLGDLVGFLHLGLDVVGDLHELLLLLLGLFLRLIEFLLLSELVTESLFFGSDVVHLHFEFLVFKT